MRSLLSLVLLAAAPMALAHPHHDHDAPAPGMPQFTGKPAVPARIVSIEMRDGACQPREVKAFAGEALRIVATNKDSRAQDIALGTAAELKSQAEMIRKFPQMQAAKAGRLTVQPGASAELSWQAPAGESLIACAPPGEFEPAKAAKVVIAR